MKLTPIGERVILKQTKQEEKTAGGIYLPESANENRKQGVVVAVGQVKDNIPIKEGDTIIYGGYSAEDIEIDNEKYTIVEIKDVVAKVN